MFGSFGAQELLIIFAIIMVLFGAKRLPEMARGLSESIREFRGATSEENNDRKEGV